MKRRLFATAIVGAALMLASLAIAADSDKVPSMPPDKALQELLDGNARYVAGKPTHPNQRPTGEAQYPKAAILCCADSRVSSQIIFDQGLGDLFVVRAAGNTYDRLLLQSIQYSIEHLGTRLIIVIGHDQCGAVAAAVKAYPKDSGPMLDNIYPAVKAVADQPGDKVSNAISENAILTAARLRKEPVFAPMVKSGELKIVAARYHFDSGKVELLAQ